MKLLVAVDLMKEPVYASSRNRAFIFTLVCKTNKKGKLKPVYFLRKGYYLVHSPDFLSLLTKHRPMKKCLIHYSDRNTAQFSHLA